MRLRLILLVGFFLTATWLRAAGQTSHEYSVTISPIELLNPNLTGSVEKRIARDAGVAILERVGSVDGYYVFSFGASLKYYPIGSFEHGLQTGVEVFYNHLESK